MPDQDFVWEDVTRSVLPYADYLPHLTKSWPYGRVFRSSSGYHGEFFKKGDTSVSLIHLGQTEVQALQFMQRITQNHIDFIVNNI